MSKKLESEYYIDNTRITKWESKQIQYDLKKDWFDKLKKSEVYPTSKYVSVKQIAIQNPNIDWTIDDVRKRAKKETKKISDFLGLDYNEV